MDFRQEMDEKLAYLWVIESDDDGIVSDEDTESHVLFELANEDTCPTMCSTGDFDDRKLDLTNDPPCDLDQIVEACSTGRVESDHMNSEHVLYDDTFDLDHVLEWDWFHNKNSADAL